MKPREMKKATTISQIVLFLGLLTALAMTPPRMKREPPVSPVPMRKYRMSWARLGRIAGRIRAAATTLNPALSSQRREKRFVSPGYSPRPRNARHLYQHVLRSE